MRCVVKQGVLRAFESICGRLRVGSVRVRLLGMRGVSYPGRWIELFLCACVIPHGATDLWEHAWVGVLACYGACVCACVCAPVRWVVRVGLCASALHFGCDGGSLGGACACACVVPASWCLHALGLDRWAFAVVCVYMAAWHLPLHYLRVGRAAGLAVSVGGGVLGACAWRAGGGRRLWARWAALGGRGGWF